MTDVHGDEARRWEPAGPRSGGWRKGRLEGVVLLVVLVLQAACATGATGRGLLAAPEARSSASGVEREAVYDVDVIEPGSVATCPVPLTREDFQRAVSRLARAMPLEAGPREEARRLLELGLEEEWLAEVYRYEILSGTESNLARHGRRMPGEFFRMLTF